MASSRNTSGGFVINLTSNLTSREKNGRAHVAERGHT